jgi:DGQHR domain-containing protein
MRRKRGIPAGKKNNASLVVRALRTYQGRKDVPVYSFFMPGGDVTKVADISRIERDQSHRLQGFQRREIRAHVKNIADYLDHGPVLFPNAIILAFSSEIQFKTSRGPRPEGLIDVAHSGTLRIPVREEGKRVAWIVDGQQRSLALARSRNQRLPVPVVGFVSDNLTLQREQFILVNKAKPLPGRLINELLPETSGMFFPRDLSERRIPSQLCNMLNEDERSPFHNLIKRPSAPGNRRSHVTDTALIEMIRQSIRNPLGALAPYKAIGESGANIERMYEVLLGYWSAVKDVFKDAWGLSPAKSRLMHSAGIQAMGVLMDKMLSRHEGETDRWRAVRDDLRKIAPHCHWTHGTWADLGLDWNEIQNLQQHIRGLSDALVRIYATKAGR